MGYFTSRAMSAELDALASLEARRAQLRREYKAMEAEVERLENELSDVDQKIEETVAAIDELQDEIDEARTGRYELD